MRANCPRTRIVSPANHPSARRASPWRWTWALGLVPLLAWAGPARAGGGPENVLLVVNARSWASLTVANHYVQLRQIPPSNILHLDWHGSNEGVTVQIFRKSILQPVLQTIRERGLGDQIDAIVYSSDLPWLIDCQQDAVGQTLSAPFTPMGSLTGVTYLWPLVLSQKIDYLRLDSNQYCHGPASAEQELPTHGFRSWYGWGKLRAPLEAGGQHYALSTMLAVTSGRGNSVREAVQYLTQSAAADGTAPRGTVYFLKNGDVRSTTRQAGFEDARTRLQALGVAAEVLDGTLPNDKQDVQGAMLGVADFSWASSGSQILPGAICEHLTSFGGIMSEDAGQTPLTELLRHGAAGASGTVVEPYAIQQKFPLPDIHVHYARGCTLAEAFYQSVAGPFQLLIVGDPLCRPWARIPQVSIEGVAANEVARGTLALVARLDPAGPAADRYEWFLDGVRRRAEDGSEGWRLDTTRIADGYHELRVVAIESTPIESQGRALVGILVDNQGHQVDFSTTPAERVRWGERWKLHAACAGAKRIVLTAGRSAAAALRHEALGDAAEWELDPKVLGSGPVVLQAFAEIENAVAGLVASPPIRVNIEPGEPLPAMRGEEQAVWKPGLRLTHGAASPTVVASTAPADWLAQAGVKSGEEWTLEGSCQVEDDIHQFQVRHAGRLVIQVDERTVYEVQEGGNLWSYAAVPLGAGRHAVRIRGTARDAPQAMLRFGARGLRSLGEAIFQHQDESK